MDKNVLCDMWVFCTTQNFCDFHFLIRNPQIGKNNHFKYCSGSVLLTPVEM